MFDITGTYTDQYQLTMGQAYFLKGKADDLAVFDYFYRKRPFSGGYAVFAGLEDILEVAEHLRFDEKDLAYLKQQGFDKDYIAYLKDFKFKGTIYAANEGEVVFPVSPILRVEGSMLEAQLLETALLNILNFQTLIATKASRIRLVAAERQLIEFGLRRAQGLGGYFASRAAVIGGFDATSHVRAGRDYGIPVSGTMAHAFVQSYDDELSAFRDFADIWPDHTVLLVDTYNTLESGLPNAITVAKEMEAKGHRLLGIRLDSGDLAYLSKKARQMLDDAGLSYVQIAASNQLDEVVIKSLLEQGACIDIFGVGTSLAIGAPDAALDGVYKLAYAHDKARIKLSESLSKTTLPGKKQVYRLLDKQGHFLGADLVALEGETELNDMYHPFEPDKSMSIKPYTKEILLKKVMEDGKRLGEPKSLDEIRAYSQQRLAQLPMEYKRFNFPHEYKVGLSAQLKEERDALKKQYMKG